MASRRNGQLLGYYQGKHYTEYVEQIESLKRAGDNQAAIDLLNQLLPVVEHESHIMGWPVAPAYYEHLAILYRKLKNHQAELDVLERYVAVQTHVPGARHAPLLARLEKARRLAADETGD